VERLKAERNFLIYGALESTEAFAEHDGQIRGFTSHMASWLSVMFGIDFQPRIFKREELAAALEAGKADFTGEFGPDDAGAGLFMTPPIAERALKTFRIRGARPMEEVAGIRRPRYVFLKGSPLRDKLRNAPGHAFDALEAADYPEAYRLLRLKVGDAFIDKGTAEAAFDGYGDVESSVLLPVTYAEASLAARNPGLRPIIDVTAKALRAGAAQGLAAVYARGNEEYRRHKYLTALTPEERRFLERRVAAGTPILFAAEHDNYPVSFYNREEGQFQGIALDVLERVSALTGLEFRPAHAGPIDWTEMLEMLEAGEASLVTELIPTRNREGRFLWSDPPFSSDKYALISRFDAPDMGVSEIIFARVGLVSDTAWAEAFRDWFRSHRRVSEYPSAYAAYDALERGEIDLLMGTRALNLGMTNYRGRQGFKVNHVFENAFESSFGFNIHESMTRSLVSKALRMIDCQSVTDRWLQRSFDSRDRIARARVPWLVGLAALLLLMLSLATGFLRRTRGESRRLERLVSLRTAELAEEREEAYRQLRARGDFLARMSHEIRTPMNAVIGMAELALRETSPEEAREMISSILRAGNSLLAIINDILDLSKIASGKMEIIPAGYRPAQLIRDAAEAAAARMAEKPLELLVEADPLLPATLIGDEVRLRQVLLNLLSNAAKYTRSGWVLLRMETEPLPPDAEIALPEGPGGDGGSGGAVAPAAGNGNAWAAGGQAGGDGAEDSAGQGGGDGSGSEDGQAGGGGSGSEDGRGGAPARPDRVLLRIEVADSGIGIRPTDMDKLFGAFAQLDQRKNRGIEGTGLGLAITRNLVLLMGGTIRAKSEYGRGSTFTAEIPQALPAAADGAREPMCSLNDPEASRALFLEPDPMRAGSLEWTLSRLGAEFSLAPDPESFRGMLREGSWDYVFAPEEERSALDPLAGPSPEGAKAVCVSPLGAGPQRHDGLLTMARPLWSLPLSRILNGESERPRSPGPAAAATFAAPTARALVVDDLPVNLKVARGLLAAFRMEVDTCESGAEAIGLAGRKAYDIIFMDHMMPGMDGIEATERIRSTPRGRLVPIIALTANAVSGMKELFLSRGMNDFISTPIELPRLEAALREWLPPEKIEAAAPSPAPARAAGDGAAPGAAASPKPEGAVFSGALKGGLRAFGMAGDGAAAAWRPGGENGGAAAAWRRGRESGRAAAPSAASGNFSPKTPAKDGGFDPDASLAQLGGDPQLLADVLAVYVQSTPQLLDSLRGLDATGLPESAMTFHSLKGSSLNVGARKVGEMAAALEKAAKEGDEAAVLEATPDFIETVEGLIWQMNSYIRDTSRAG
jgi:signal transduction histidine kinase/HPt (histidine-containing phosphotransfer) domain-containing protein/ActR/RegA family two-component response regulator